MIAKELATKDYFHKYAKSKIKFCWDYKNELKKLVSLIVEKLEESDKERKIIKFIETSNNGVKIKIDDKDRKITRIIECIIRHDNNDEKYGNCHIELVTKELSKKARLYYVGKFQIQNHNDIAEKIIKDLSLSIEEIY